jgi:hypothetical protein
MNNTANILILYYLKENNIFLCQKMYVKFPKINVYNSEE